MGHNPHEVQFTPYGPDQFDEREPFARRGYLFTVPGTFPADTPAHTNPADCEMAVYRAHGEWEVRDVDSHKQWGIGPSRRAATGLAFAGIARARRREAARITEERVRHGLEPVPPFQVEITTRLTLFLTPHGIGRLILAESDQSTGYRVLDLDTGREHTVPVDDELVLHTVTTGIFHHDCDCDPVDAVRFEDEPAAALYARWGLTNCWPCPKAV